MQEHTKEPWQRGWEHETRVQIVDTQGREIAEVHKNFLSNLPGAAGNADRIIACVNACAGIPTTNLLHNRTKVDLFGTPSPFKNVTAEEALKAAERVRATLSTWDTAVIEHLPAKHILDGWKSDLLTLVDYAFITLNATKAMQASQAELAK